MEKDSLEAITKILPGKPNFQIVSLYRITRGYNMTDSSLNPHMHM